METVGNTSRFKDKNYTLWDFVNCVLVECPKCKGKAEVKGKGMFSTYKEDGDDTPELKCFNCFHKEQLTKKKFDLRVHRNCDNCGEKIEVLIANTSKKKDKIRIKCGNCGQTREYTPSYGDTDDYVTLTMGTPKDPYFGQPLWLQESFKSFTFWAFNYKHLDYLDAYIKSKLRERNNRNGWTLIERLPTFIKEAKNREKLGVIIEQLRKK